MDEFAYRYRRALLARDMQPVQEAQPQPKGSRLRAQETAPSLAQGATAFMDMLAGTLKGTTAVSMGLPGDIEGRTDADRWDADPADDGGRVREAAAGHPGGRRSEPQHTADTAQALGEFAVVPGPLKIGSEAAKLIGRLRAAQAPGKCGAEWPGCSCATRRLIRR
jgi:hypothetical protein